MILLCSGIVWCSIVWSTLPAVVRRSPSGRVAPRRRSSVRCGPGVCLLWALREPVGRTMSPPAAMLQHDSDQRRIGTKEKSPRHTQQELLTCHNLYRLQQPGCAYYITGPEKKQEGRALFVCLLYPLLSVRCGYIVDTSGAHCGHISARCCVLTHKERPEGDPPVAPPNQRSLRARENATRAQLSRPGSLLFYHRRYQITSDPDRRKAPGCCRGPRG